MAERGRSTRRRRRRPLHLRLGAPEPAAGASASSRRSDPRRPALLGQRPHLHRQGKLEATARAPRSTAPPAGWSSPPATASTAARASDGASVWSDYLEFVPAYSGGVAPFGAFVARRATIRAPPQWIKHGNPDFDIGAFLTQPNSEGVNVADAVGGGATIVLDLTRHQAFQTFGYPGKKTRLQRCESPYVGDDPLTYPFPARRPWRSAATGPRAPAAAAG